LYTPANSASLGWSARALIVYPSRLWFAGVISQGSYYIPELTLVSLGWSARVPIVYPSQLWFVRVVSQGSCCIPQLTLVHWSDQSGYTKADSSSKGWSARVSIVCPSHLWFAGVVSQGSYYIPQLTLVRWADQPGFLMYIPANSVSLGWSARVLNVYPSRLRFIGVVN